MPYVHGSDDRLEVGPALDKTAKAARGALGRHRAIARRLEVWTIAAVHAAQSGARARGTGRMPSALAVPNPAEKARSPAPVMMATHSAGFVS